MTCSCCSNLTGHYFRDIKMSILIKMKDILFLPLTAKASVNSGPWDKSYLLPIFVNKGLMKQSLLFLYVVYFEVFILKAAKLKSCDKLFVLQSIKQLQFTPLQEKFTSSCFKEQLWKSLGGFLPLGKDKLNCASSFKR